MDRHLYPSILRVDLLDDQEYSVGKLSGSAAAHVSSDLQKRPLVEDHASGGFKLA